jgi:lipopolysaccharide export system protein LptC
MKGEDQILELLAEVLRRQDQTQEKLQRITEEIQSVKQDAQDVKTQLGTVIESQQGHQQALRMLAINQQKSQSELQNIVDILDSVARMQRDTNRRLDRLEYPGDFAS